MSADATQPLRLSAQDARRLAITKQRLAGERSSADLDGLMQVMEAIRCLQLDPISVVARSPLLVLWSRLGKYDPDLLRRALWDERLLFEYWAHAASVVLLEDWPLHRRHMDHHANGGWRPRTQQWLEENRALREHILKRLAADGPLAPADFSQEEVGAEWQSSGWTNQRTVNQLLDCMWTEGTVVVAGRSGRTRLWDLPHRFLPEQIVLQDALPAAEVVEKAVQLSLRALGVGTERHIRQHFVRGRYPDLPRVMQRLVKQGTLLAVAVEDDDEDWPGDWYVHADDLPLLQEIQNGRWQPRTTLLSPFDNLICDRDRTEVLFDFYFRIEIYVPPAKRQYGYYVLPILHGDRLIGRLDPRFDRKSKQLLVNAVYAEAHAEQDAEAGRAAAHTIGELAHFLEADEVVYQGNAPDAWRASLT